MKVLITGGTGYLGSHTVAAVAQAGHEVRLLVRNRANVPRALEPLGVDPGSVEVVVGDVTDRAGVAEAVAGVAGVIHLATVFSMDSRDAARMRKVCAPGTGNLLEEAADAGADPIVFGSSYAALLPSSGPLSTESPPGKVTWSLPPYFAVQSEAETTARRHQAEGVPVVIVNLLATLGPHDPHLGDQLTRLRNAVQGRLRFLPTGGFNINDVRDAAALLAATLTPGLGPQRYLPGGHHVSTREYLELVETVTGRRRRCVYPPGRATLPVCWCVDRIQRLVPWHIPAEYTAAYMCWCNAEIDARMPDAPLGVKPRPLLETFGDSIRWLYEQGHISARLAGLAAVGA